uniref:Uncharacterized protein n=1 Tax=Setaria viridis TaxID=4556 RepID=A0A4U6UJ70_SETVI|nr:hypothetical protein SEVIR_5G191600v2 [Setaria viridis]
MCIAADGNVDCQLLREGELLCRPAFCFLKGQMKQWQRKKETAEEIVQVGPRMDEDDGKANCTAKFDTRDERGILHQGVLIVWYCLRTRPIIEWL